MQLPPAEVLLSWPLPNYVNPVTRGGAALIVNIITIIIATIVTGLRIFTRLRITYTPGLDDLVIVISLVREHHSLACDSIRLTSSSFLQLPCVWSLHWLQRALGLNVTSGISQ